MEENKKENDQNVEDVKNENIEETEKFGTQANENKDEEQAEQKTFSQEQVNAMLAKEKKKLPSKEELKAFKEWQESKKTAEQKQAEKETAYQKALSDLIEKDNYIAVLESGVKKDDSDYVLYKVSKMEGDFEENLQEFLKSNPKYTQKFSDDISENNVTDGVSVKNNNVKKDDGVTAILKQKHPELFN